MSLESDTSLKLSQLIEGKIRGVSRYKGAAHYEACMVCLEDQQHLSGSQLNVTGDYECVLDLWWDSPVTDDQIATWGDREEATEEGACGLAILLVLKLTEFTVVQRAYKSMGFDYWLGTKSDVGQLIFNGTARLEVSGMRHEEKESRIRARVHDKIKQTEKFESPLPRVVIVVEFSRPVSHVVRP